MIIMRKFTGIMIDESLTPDTILYRYIGLNQFLSLVETKKTYLSKIKSWEDTWEVPAGKIPIQTIDGKIETPLYSIYDDIFGQCWSFEGFSDALWRIYSPNKEGIMITTSVKKFLLMEYKIKSGMLGRVIYYDDLKQALDYRMKFKRPKNAFIDGFLKRNAFEHEKEVRLVTINTDFFLGKRIPNCNFMEVNIDPINFIDDIAIDPRANDHYVNIIKKYCERAGFTIIPKKSNLYSDVHEETHLVRQFKPKKK